MRSPCSSSNTTVEPEFYRALPDGVAAHAAMVRLDGEQLAVERLG